MHIIADRYATYLVLKFRCVQNQYIVFIIGSRLMFLLFYVCHMSVMSELKCCVHYVVVSSRSMASKTPVGFIGLGNMGNPMAKNLLKHGYPIIATDVFPESCKEVQELGAQV